MGIIATTNLKLIPLKPIAFKPSGGSSTPAATPTFTYWYENGVAWSISSNASTPPQLVGFPSLAALTLYFSGAVVPAAAPFYVVGAFSSTDFPIALASSSSASVGLFYLFAGSWCAPFAQTFLYSLNGYLENDGASNTPASVSPLISWAQAASLSVQTPAGAQTISLSYLVIASGSDAKKGIATQWNAGS